VANCRGAASRKEVGAARSRSHRPVATRGPPPTQQSNLISLSISTVSRSRRWRHRWRDPQTARPARRRRPGGGGVRWAAGEEFDTSPKRIKTPACAARGAVLVCSVCVSLSLSPPSSFLQRSPSLSPLRAGATAPSLSIPRLLQGRRVSNSAHSSGAREKKQLGGREPAAAVHDRLLVGCRSTGAPPPGEACLPWFSDPGGKLALQAKEPFFSLSSGSCPPFPVSCSVYALVRLVIAERVFPC
jgi:hypothetical protein